MKTRLFGSVSVIVALASASACGSFSEGNSEPASAEAGPIDTGAVSDASSDSYASSPGDGGCGDCLAVLATLSHEPIWIAVDGARVLWMDSLPQGGGIGDLLACPKTGCLATGPETILKARAGAFLTSDGTTAFASVAFGNDLGVHRLNGDGTRTTIATQAAIDWLVLRDNVLYMTEYGSSLARSVHVLDLGTSQLGSDCLFPAGTVNTDWTVVTDQRIFLGAHNVGGLYVCPKTGGVFSSVLANGGSETYVWSMATDDANVFWVDSLDRLQSCPATTNSCNPTTVLSSPNAAYAGGIRTVVHSKGDLVMTTSGGDLVACKASACPGTVKHLTRETAFAESWRVSGSALAADDAHIFYAAQDGTPDAGNVTYRLMRLPRTAP